MELSAMWDLLVRGVLRGGLFASMAMGLSLVLGVMNISSFAHGEFLMIGAYVAYFVVEGLGLPPLLAIAVAGVVGFAVGVVVEKLMFYRMRRSTESDEWVMNSFLATVGLSFVLKNLVQAIVGAKYRGVDHFWEGSVYFLSDMGVSIDRVVAFGIAMVSIAAIWIFLERTRLGRGIRAASQDEAGAMLVGVKLDKINSFTFALSCLMGGISGASLLSLAPAFPTMGTLYTTKSWFVVIIAGLGNVGGAIPAAFIVGLLETVFFYFIGQGWQDVPSLAFLALILLLKPTGLFGSAVKGKLEQ